MPQEICLCLNDDGTMTVSTEITEEAAEVEETGNKVPVKTIDEALAMIKQFATEASMGPEETGEEPGMPEGEEPAAEEEAMMGGFRPGVTGR